MKAHEAEVTAGQQGSPVAAGTGRPRDTSAAVSIPALCAAHHFKCDASDLSAACWLASRVLTRRRCRFAVRASRGTAAGPRLHATGGGSTPEVSQLSQEKKTACHWEQSLHLRAVLRQSSPVLTISNSDINLHLCSRPTLLAHHSVTEAGLLERPVTRKT